MPDHPRPSSSALPPVVLDTNVLIASAFRPGSGSGRVVRAVREGLLPLRWDPATRDETERLFRRIPPIDWGQIAALYREEGRVEVPPSAPGAFDGVPDPEDRKFAALARAAGAVLVSMDAHLLRAGLGTDPEVVTPGELVARLGLP